MVKVREFNNYFVCFRVYIIVFFLVLVLFHFSGCKSIEGFTNNGATGLINPDESQEQPFQALDNLDPKIRAKGAEALGKLTPIKNRYMEAYVRSLDERDVLKTTKGLSEIDDLAMSLSPVIESLVNSSRDYDSRVRYEALSSLYVIYDQIIITVEPLEKFEIISPDTDKNISQSAKNILIVIREMIGNTSAAMNTALSDPVRKVRKIAEKFILNSKRKPKIIEESIEKIETDKGQDQPEKLDINNPSVIVEDQPVDNDSHKNIEPAPTPTPTPAENKNVNVTSDPHPVKEVKADTVESVPATSLESSEGIKTSEKFESTEAKDVEAPVSASKPDDDEAEAAINSKNIERFLKQLESFELSNRRFALMAMSPYIDKELAAVPETISSVEKGDIAVRIESAEQIVEKAERMKEVVASLCHTTEDVDKEMRLKSLKNLGLIIEPLATALTPFEKAPKEIEDALTKEKVEVEQLIRIQIDQFKKLSEQGIDVITGIIAKSIPFMINSLNDSVLEVRNTASEGLRNMMIPADKDIPMKPVWDSLFKKVSLTPDDIKIRLLMNDLTNPGVDMARNAARAISEMGVKAKSAVPALIDVVKNRKNLHVHYKYVQMDAMAALGTMGSDAKDAVPALMDQLTDIRFEIRSSAILALGRIGGKEATSYIVDILENDKSSLVRESAAQALSNLDPSECLDKTYILLFKSLKDSSQEIRMSSFTALASYERLNRGAGIIMWKPFEKSVKGYMVCTGKTDNSSDCRDNGFGTAFRLGDFKLIPKNATGVTVKSIQEDGSVAVDFKFVDIMSILEKSASNETHLELKEKKNKALLELMKNLLNSDIYKE